MNYIQWMKQMDLSKITSRQIADTQLAPHVPVRHFLLWNLIDKEYHGSTVSIDEFGCGQLRKVLLET
jgi:hypothetical protein